MPRTRAPGPYDASWWRSPRPPSCPRSCSATPHTFRNASYAARIAASRPSRITQAASSPDLHDPEKRSRMFIRAVTYTTSPSIQMTVRHPHLQLQTVLRDLPRLCHRCAIGSTLLVDESRPSTHPLTSAPRSSNCARRPVTNIRGDVAADVDDKLCGLTHHQPLRQISPTLISVAYPSRGTVVIIPAFSVPHRNTARVEYPRLT